ncbi:MAG: RNA polymerase sigma factor [Butyricimonas faecihominis]
MQHNFDITNNGEIVDALIKGDEATFAMVYKSYFTSLRNYATTILSDQEAAYEIVQNLFVTLWENRKKLDREKSLRNYLLRELTIIRTYLKTTPFINCITNR